MYTVKATQEPITIHFQSNAAFSACCAKGFAPLLLAMGDVVVVMMVLVSLVVIVIVIVFVAVMVVVMSVIVVVMVAVVMMRVPLDVARGRRNSRIFAKDERLDRHRHSERRHAHAAEIDVVEVPERDAVQHQHVGPHAELLLQERAQRVGDIVVQNDEQRLFRRERARERLEYPAGETSNARVGGCAVPAECKRHFRIALDEIETVKMLTDSRRDR